MNESFSEALSAKSIRALIATTAIVAVTIAWWWSRSTVQLNENHYAITLALYRVCNQRSQSGLDQIETILAESPLPIGESSNVSRDAVRSIIDEARQERWQQALEQCRELLDDQVRR